MIEAGKYNAYGCSCMATESGKRQVIEAIAPSQWEKSTRPQGRKEFSYGVARVVRTDDGQGKRYFHQEHFDGKRWVKGLPDEVKGQIHLYRIADAKARNQPILLVEGEGKADQLFELGIPATCSIGGSGKWTHYGHKNYLADLKGCQVVLCPDRDLPGVKHCEEVEADLLAHGIEVVGWLYAYPESCLWRRLPGYGGADVADWISDGATREQILAAVGPKRQPRLQDPQAEPPKQLKIAQNFDVIEKAWGQDLAFNELTNKIELSGQDVEDLNVLRLTLAKNCGLGVSLLVLEAILKTLAKSNSYHPVQRYLEACSSQHGDSTSILEGLAARYFGTTDPIYDTFLGKTLIAAVARIFEPGCKVDTALILQGKQGVGKSQFFKTLAGSDWFDDSMGAASDRDERLKLYQFWFLEWAELESVFRRKDVAAIKAFLSSSVDTIRAPYDRCAKTMKRRSLIVGTTNQDDFLTDDTGNRRFWIIPVARKIDVDLIRSERDQVWAAAVALYRMGSQWWLSSDETAIAANLNQQWEFEDSWTGTIQAYLRGKDEVTIAELLSSSDSLGLEKGR